MSKINIQCNKYILSQQFFQQENDFLFNHFPVKEYYCSFIYEQMDLYSNKDNFQKEEIINIIKDAYCSLFGKMLKHNDIIDKIIQDYEHFIDYTDNFLKYVAFEDEDINVAQIKDIVQFIQAELKSEEMFHLEYKTDTYEWNAFITTSYNTSISCYVRDNNLSEVIRKFYYYASNNRYKNFFYNK